MSALIKQAAEHWHYVEPLLARPTSEADYDVLVEALDELLAIIGADENHPLATLAAHMGDLIETYDEEHRPMPPTTGTDTLRYLMQEHGLGQGDLPEIGAQSVVSEVLSGKRRLNVRHIRALAKRFQLPAELFF